MASRNGNGMTTLILMATCVATLTASDKVNSFIASSWRSVLGVAYGKARAFTTRTALEAITPTRTLSYGSPGNRTVVESPTLFGSLARSFAATVREFIGKQLLAALAQ